MRTDSPLKYAGAAATVGAAAFLIAYESESAVVSSMCEVFERGGVPDWEKEFFADLAPGVVPRQALQDTLQALLYPDSTLASKSYAVVVGASGTGKSTAVRLAVRAVGSSRAKGAVYYLAPTGITSFSTGLMHALHYREPFSLLSPLRRLVIGEPKDSPDLQSPMPQPVASWRVLAPVLKAAAARFRARHGRPAVLVLDAMDLVAKEDPKFFTEVQNFAKEYADKGTLRVVLVFSDGRALPLLQGNSARTRAVMPLEVGDISDKEALTFLKALEVDAVRAEALVREVAGGRFSLLLEHAPAAQDVGAIVSMLHNRTDEVLTMARVLPTGQLFRVLLEKGSISSAVALRLLEQEKITLLLQSNILVAHPDGKYTFHSRHVESFIARACAEASITEVTK
jgi:hypothetical protein